MIKKNSNTGGGSMVEFAFYNTVPVFRQLPIYWDRICTILPLGSIELELEALRAVAASLQDDRVCDTRGVSRKSRFARRTSMRTSSSERSVNDVEADDDMTSSIFRLLHIKLVIIVEGPSRQ
jgi:hypothetical protein